MSIIGTWVYYSQRHAVVRKLLDYIFSIFQTQLHRNFPVTRDIKFFSLSLFFMYRGLYTNFPLLIVY
jgi:Kef-type K+ transport system membrane component KefB